MEFTSLLFGIFIGVVLGVWNIDGYIATCAKNGRKIDHQNHWYKVIEVNEPETEKEADHAEN